jgi:biopolymer transport protein ExbD
MAFGSTHRRGHIVAEINVTPLTDVFLVLLIIFMITTSAMVKPAADVNLPETSDQQQDVTDNVMVTMTPAKQIYVGDRAVDGDDAAVVSALKDALARAKQKVVVLAGDRQVVLGEVVRVLSLAKEAGASGFALASE